MANNRAHAREQVGRLWVLRELGGVAGNRLAFTFSPVSVGSGTASLGLGAVPEVDLEANVVNWSLGTWASHKFCSCRDVGRSLCHHSLGNPVGPWVMAAFDQPAAKCPLGWHYRLHVAIVAPTQGALRSRVCGIDHTVDLGKC